MVISNYLIGYLLGGLILLTVLLLVAKRLRPHRPNVQKLHNYESGELSRGSVWVQTNIRFYILAIAFLLFEIEIVMLFPWATVYHDQQAMELTMGSWGWMALIEIMVFVGLLAIGLAYIWVNGHLDALVSKPEVTQIRKAVPMSSYQKINEKR